MELRCVQTQINVILKKDILFRFWQGQQRRPCWPWRPTTVRMVFIRNIFNRKPEKMLVGVNALKRLGCVCFLSFLPVEKHYSEWRCHPWPSDSICDLLLLPGDLYRSRSPCSPGWSIDGKRGHCQQHTSQWMVSWILIRSNSTLFVHRGQLVLQQDIEIRETADEMSTNTIWGRVLPPS